MDPREPRGIPTEPERDSDEPSFDREHIERLSNAELVIGYVVFNELFGILTDPFTAEDTSGLRKLLEHRLVAKVQAREEITPANFQAKLPLLTEEVKRTIGIFESILTERGYDISGQEQH
ncbi:MAG: hypothetical protein WC080_02955 [Patescibacteria group bacterium]